MGTVTGPGSSVVGNVVLWDNTTGTLVSDSGETSSLEGLSNITYQTGGSPSNMIIGQQVTLASGATENTFIGELACECRKSWNRIGGRVGRLRKPRSRKSADYASG